MGMSFLLILIIITCIFILIQYAIFIQLPLSVRLFLSANLWANTGLNLILSGLLVMFTGVGAVAGIANLFAGIPVSYFIMINMKKYMPTYYDIRLGIYRKTNYIGLPTSHWGFHGFGFKYSSISLDTIREKSYQDLLRLMPSLNQYKKLSVIKTLESVQFSIKNAQNKLKGA